MIRKESITVAIFLLAIVLPVFGMMLKIDRFSQHAEKRELAKAPQFTFTVDAIEKFPLEYASYFNDHFGFRNSLVRINYIIRYGLLGVSPSKQVIVGKDGWLFYNSEGTIDDYRGITKYDDNRLDRWAKTLEMKRVWLEKQGIHYLFVIAPNKSSIYGEFLPDSYNRVRNNTGLDELIVYLKKHTKVEVVDIRQALIRAKEKVLVYHKTDSHWNEYGAFIAYCQIMKPIVEWFPSLKMKTVDDYLIEKKITGGGDLTAMIGGTGFISEESISFKSLDNHSLEIDGINNIVKSPITVEHNNSSLPRALIFRDSFLSQVAQFMAEHFQYSSYYWQYWNISTPIEEMIKTQKPDVVIEEMVERLVKYNMSDFVENPPDYMTKVSVFSELMPSIVSGKPFTTGGKINVEILNKINLETANAPKFVKSDNFKLTGWAIDEISKTTPATVIVQLTSTSNNKSYYAIASRYNRGDVANYFKEPSYEKAGFILSADVKSLSAGSYSINIIQATDNTSIVANSSRVIELN